MAPHLRTVWSVARTGSRVVRYLIRPAQRRAGLSPDPWGRDPWLSSPAALPSPGALAQRGANLTRRALGLGVLMILTVLGAVVLGVTLLLLGLSLASGSEVAGWLMGLTLLLGALGAWWSLRRAGTLIRAQDAQARVAPVGSGPVADLAQDEATLLGTLRSHERALPSSARPALRATIIATRDALRVSSADATLSRETFDVRQAARADLPELLDAYRSVPRTPQNDAELKRQLELIEARMQGVIRDRAAQEQRTLKAHGRYLENKYAPSDSEE